MKAFSLEVQDIFISRKMEITQIVVPGQRILLPNFCLKDWILMPNIKVFRQHVTKFKVKVL